MTTMQDMFDLNTAIDQLKDAKTKDFNFEVKDGELETNIHLFANTERFPQIVQDMYIDFNRHVKEDLQSMIDALVEERDEMTMKILQKNSQTMNDIHNETVNEVSEHQKQVDKAYEELRQLTEKQLKDNTKD